MLNLSSHLEDDIQKLYKRLGISKPYQLNKYLIGERLNIGVYLIRGSSEAIYQDGRPYIFINKDLDKKGRWQDFGHELCHILRHAGHQSKMPKSFRELQEWQANNFMYHFCVPSFMLHEINLPTDQQAAASLISELFNVELQFAEHRLNAYRRKWIEGLPMNEKTHHIWSRIALNYR